MTTFSFSDNMALSVGTGKEIGNSEPGRAINQACLYDNKCHNYARNSLMTNLQIPVCFHRCYIILQYCLPCSRHFSTNGKTSQGVFLCFVWLLYFTFSRGALPLWFYRNYDAFLCHVVSEHKTEIVQLK